MAAVQPNPPFPMSKPEMVAFVIGGLVGTLIAYRFFWPYRQGVSPFGRQVRGMLTAFRAVMCGGAFQLAAYLLFMRGQN
jgi:hypothetical protein